MMDEKITEEKSNLKLQENYNFQGTYLVIKLISKHYINNMKEESSKIAILSESSFNVHKIALFFTYALCFSYALVYLNCSRDRGIEVQILHMNDLL